MEKTKSGVPKVIHYCWFGGGKKSPLIEHCIQSWRNQMPGWEIREWNESNFDVNAIPYTAQAYAQKKYAFVSDYARFWILHQEGGVCLCTDVEVLQSYEPLLEQTPALFGFELHNTVNPGSIMAAPAGEPLIAEILQEYQSLQFVRADGSLNKTTIVKYTTDVLLRHGFTGGNQMQTVAGFALYPNEYFSPFEHETQMFLRTANTHSVHHYTATWSPWWRKARFRAIGLAARVLGRERYLRWKRKIKR